jgi:hypothetical protein
MVKGMSYCPKCGANIDESMSFCPKCGAPLKGAVPAPPETRPPTYRRGEKSEKEEKHEKREKHEKHEFGLLGPLIGGLILIFIGVTTYLRVTGIYSSELMWAFFFVLIGIIVIALGVYAASTAAKRHPKA